MKSSSFPIGVLPLSLLSFALSAFVLIVVFIVLYLQLSSQIQQQHLETTQRLAKAYASKIEARVLVYKDHMDFLVKDRKFVEQFIKVKSSQLRLLEGQLLRRIPEVERIQLFRINDIDLDTAETLGFADFSMLEKAMEQSKIPNMAVHLFRQQGQHIALARNIIDPENRQVVGVMLLSLPISLLKDAIESGSENLGVAYLELQQTVMGEKAVLSLVRIGNDVYSHKKPDGYAHIIGSIWQIAFWVNESSVSFLVFWIMLLILLLALLGFQLLGFHLFSKALRQDQKILLAMATDIARGRIKKPEEYIIAITDLRPIVGKMLVKAREIRSESSSSQFKSTVTEASQATDAGIIEKTPIMAEDNSMDADASQSATDQTSSQASSASPIEMSDDSLDTFDSIFRAYDIRGVVDENLNTDIMQKLGQAIGSQMYDSGQTTVVVARDGRLSSADFAKALCQGLQSAGAEVIDIGMVATPVLYFATHELQTYNGVMITGSHNPVEYNGLKIMINGDNLDQAQIQDLKQRILQGQFVTGQGRIKTQDMVSTYIERIITDVLMARDLKVVVDCGNGVAGVVAPTLFMTLGCDVVELYCEVDGNFPHHPPDPSQPENLADLIKTVKRERADLGVAFDGDGDRLAVVDSEGNIIWADRQMMLYSADILSRNPGADVIYDVKSSRHLAREIVKYGGRPFMWKAGYTLIKAKMKEVDALLAGEMSGHIFFKERWYGFDDALYACARLLEILAIDPRPTNEVFAELPESYSTPEIYVKLPEGHQFTVMEQLEQQQPFKQGTLTVIDGFRVEFEDAWGLVRASNTVPALMLRFEADDEAAMLRIQKEFKDILLAVEPGLSLPF